MPKRKILVVEADRSLLDVLMFFFLDNEFDVLCASSVLEAEQYCKVIDFDVVLTDFSGAIDGCAVARLAHIRNRTIPVIGMAGDFPGLSSVINTAKQEKVSMIIRKPCDLNLLLKVIKAARLHSVLGGQNYVGFSLN